jgi:hypothetical protein
MKTFLELLCWKIVDFFFLNYVFVYILKFKLYKCVNININYIRVDLKVALALLHQQK